MEIIVATILLIGSTVSGASYFVMKHTSENPVNGEVEHLNKIENVLTSIENLSKAQ